MKTINNIILERIENKKDIADFLISLFSKNKEEIKELKAEELTKKLMKTDILKKYSKDIIENYQNFSEFIVNVLNNIINKNKELLSELYLEFYGVEKGLKNINNISLSNVDFYTNTLNMTPEELEYFYDNYKGDFTIPYIKNSKNTTKISDIYNNASDLELYDLIKNSLENFNISVASESYKYLEKLIDNQNVKNREEAFGLLLILSLKSNNIPTFLNNTNNIKKIITNNIHLLKTYQEIDPDIYLQLKTLLKNINRVDYLEILKYLKPDKNTVVEHFSEIEEDYHVIIPPYLKSKYMHEEFLDKIVFSEYFEDIVEDTPSVLRYILENPNINEKIIMHLMLQFSDQIQADQLAKTINSNGLYHKLISERREEIDITNIILNKSLPMNIREQHIQDNYIIDFSEDVNYEYILTIINDITKYNIRLNKINETKLNEFNLDLEDEFLLFL